MKEICVTVDNNNRINQFGVGKDSINGINLNVEDNFDLQNLGNYKVVNNNLIELTKEEKTAQEENITE